MLSQRKCINFSDKNVYKPSDLKGKSFYHETQTQKNVVKQRQYNTGNFISVMLHNISFITE